MARPSRVEDVMTVGCESIGEHDSISEAARKMKHFDIGALPIRGDDGKLKGMITDRDIVVRVVCEGMDPERTEAGVLRGTTVVCHPDDEIDQAIALMMSEQVRRLPVIDGKDALMGMISQGDIATHVDSSSSGNMLANISRPY